MQRRYGSFYDKPRRMMDFEGSKLDELRVGSHGGLKFLFSKKKRSHEEEEIATGSFGIFSLKIGTPIV